MKKKSYMRVMILSFVALYLGAMILVTFIEEKRYEFDNYNQSSSLWYDDVYTETVFMTNPMTGEFIETVKDVKGYITYMISDWSSYYMDQEYQKFSFAAYTTEGEKVAQTSNVLYLYAGTQDYYFDLNQYFSESEIEFLKKIYMDILANDEYSSWEERKPIWFIHAYVNENTGELAKLLFTTKSEYVNRVDETIYEMPNNETKWSWNNPDESVHDNLTPIGNGVHMGFELRFPYLRQGEKEYSKWLNDDFLQGYPEFWNEFKSGGFEEETFVEKRYEYVFTAIIDGEEYVFKFRQISAPWLQAIDSLKSLYLFSGLFVVACLLVVVRSLNQYYSKREVLETTRRDFTNAIAHELKTPLGIIRGFAENSLEGTNEKKRDYYLKQIIGQTEEMDKLVKEMIYISKLDSDELVSEKERLSIADIVKEQLEKLEVLSEEKNLNISMTVAGDFEVKGDKKYLERAIWNLLNNAIEYNHLDGFIKINIDKTQLKIENSGVKIGDDELPYVFDMFYTSDKSRNFSKKHMGLGLYLAKKIFELHKMNISIGNTDAGVEVVINM